jgi:hypothetical protein
VTPSRSGSHEVRDRLNVRLGTLLVGERLLSDVGVGATQ